MAFSAHVASCHVARLGSNNFILLQFGQHPFSILLRAHNSLFHNVGADNKPRNGFVFSHNSSPAAIIASNFVYSPVDHYMPRKYVFLLIQQPNLAWTNYSHTCNLQFPQDHLTWTVARDFYKPLPLKWRFPTFHYRTFSFCNSPIVSSLEPSEQFT